MEEQIHTFDGDLLAFWRPRKRTFYFLEWDDTGSRWEHYEGDHAPFTLHKSTFHRDGTVNIRVKGSRQLLQVKCDGRFLRLGTVIIPIGKGNRPVPPHRIKKEYTLSEEVLAPDAYLVDRRLWTVRPPAPAAPAPAPTVRSNSMKLEPIPRRIAWLIADDACLNNETCSISLENITPITASVTTCFHVFQTEHLNTWFKQQVDGGGRRTCPVCRKLCLAQEAFDTTGLMPVSGSQEAPQEA
jgi:hypothetical protein